MKLPRPPDWLIYLTVVGALAWLAVAVQERADPPPAPPPMPALAGAPLAPASPFDPAAVVEAPARPGPGSGTAFSVSHAGVWLSARHVVEGCARAAIVVAPGRAVAARARIFPSGDIAILYTRGGTPPLPIAAQTPLRQGAVAFHPGFPGGRAGEAASRLIGRMRLTGRGRGARVQPVLAWAEIGRTADLPSSLAGLSGAPALDGGGRVVGVTIAQAPRRGLIYTTTPASLRTALTGAGVQAAPGPGQPMAIGSYGRLADGLRRDLRVAPVVCLAS
ncbi:MAG: S1 family peptidase [Caulobacteraceae bacterium]